MSRLVKIANKMVGSGQPIYIIAEIGINHNGDIENVKKLIDIAIIAGCDAVKFQKRTVGVVYSKKFLDLPRESPWGTTQRHQKEGLEFGKKEYDAVDAYCKRKKIDWFASAWDLESQKFLRRYRLKYNKISSAMLTYFPLVEEVVKEGKPTFISTAACSFLEIDKAVKIFRKHRCPFTLMHCVGSYPVGDEDLNLHAIKALRDRYRCDVGYSGHEVGVMPSVLAVSLGAVAIERHITLDRAMYGTDQPASLEKRGLEILVRDCRLARLVMGDGKKRIQREEIERMKKLRWFENGT